MEPLTKAARLEFLRNLTEEEKAGALYNWRFWARPEQLAPEDDDWRFWLVMSGRGFGKTRLGAEWVRDECERNPKARIALVGPTLQDVRETMIEGESGILECCPPWNYPKYHKSRLMLVWPNGARAKGYGAEKPERIRGANLTGAWCDEFAAWAEKAEDGGTGADAWKNLKLATRKGKCRIVLTTTPRRKKRLKALLKRCDSNPSTYRLQKGRTDENLCNLGPNYLEMIEDFQGTSLGAQELNGDYLEDVEGALWTMALIESTRRWKVPELVRVVVGVDPATKTKKDSDETGIVVGGIDKNGHVWIFLDLSGKYKPDVWPRIVLDVAIELGATIVIETNKIGEMAEYCLRVGLKPGERPPRIEEVHSSDGKDTRIEPFVGLWQKGLAHIVGYLAGLEEYMTTWVPGTTSGSPDPLDALGHLLTKLVPKRASTAKRRRRPAGM